MSDDNTRRHWHGNPGDRYEQTNVWMQGGAKARSPRAAWAMPDTDPARRESNTSTSSNNKTDGTSSFPTINDRRRSSSTGSTNGLFSNLHSQKRESTNPELASRRASWNEQAAKGGFFSKWWDGYTRGNPSK